jgi:hypothetical protein
VEICNFFIQFSNNFVNNSNGNSTLIYFVSKKKNEKKKWENLYKNTLHMIAFSFIDNHCD